VVFPERPDWAGDHRSYALVWGLPTAALIGAIFVDPPAKTMIWTGALLLMGGACLANAHRCGRTHCYFTGPFFLIMAVVVLLHGSAAVWLGPAGWQWLGLTIAVGAAALWWLPERLWGKFIKHGHAAHARRCGGRDPDLPSVLNV
jgi:hypothetical protein